MKWKRIAIIVADVVIFAYLVLAVTAFNKPDVKATVCTEVKINIEESLFDGFLTTGEVRRILERQQAYPYGKDMAAVDTRRIEELLNQNVYVERAECYKTQGGHICIDLKQHVPVLHVMAAGPLATTAAAADTSSNVRRRDNYYMDADGNIMPGAQYANNVIVATGNITRDYARNVLQGVVSHIVYDKFWQNQVEQLNVLPDGSVELVPRVGDHIAYLGQPVGVAQKLDRLRKFYKYGLNQAGWNKYSYVSVEFDNQIVCKKRQAP